MTTIKTTVSNHSMNTFLICMAGKTISPEYTIELQGWNDSINLWTIGDGGKRMLRISFTPDRVTFTLDHAGWRVSKYIDDPDAGKFDSLLREFVTKYDSYPAFIQWLEVMQVSKDPCLSIQRIADVEAV